MPTHRLYDTSNPSGIWRCTRSSFSEFSVGSEYPCLPSHDNGHRIYPRLHRGTWAPYWVPHRARFCYEAEKLDFVFVRPLSSSEQDALIRQRDETPARTHPHIKFPLEFAEEEAEPPQQDPSAPLLTMRKHARDALIFLAGAASATIAFLAV